jgi:hypothetical protein
VAFEGIYGYKKDCDFCRWCSVNDRKIIGLKNFERPNRIKCYECAQINFKRILKHITEGKSFYEDIGSLYLPALLSNAYGSFIRKHINLKSGNFVESYYFYPFNIFNFFKYPSRDKFIHTTFGGFISISLAEFLLRNDRRKLKLCQHCDKFFIAKKLDPNRKFCSDCSSKNRMSREERRNYQRQYRQKKKQDRIAQEREAKIMNYIDKLGCTREKAIEIIEADAMM